MTQNFLPVCREDMEARGWEQADFLFVSGDAYVDHPSFAPAVIGRVLEAEGYSVSAGWAWARAPIENLKALIKAAEKKMYSEKREYYRDPSNSRQAR